MCPMEAVRLELEQQLADELYNLFQAEILQKIMRESKVEQGRDYIRSKLEGHCFKLTQRMAPRLHELCRSVQETLRFTEPVEFFILSDATLNCTAYPRIEDQHEHLIMINSGLVERFTDDELRFVIGHELGHLLSRNADLMRVIQFVFPPTANVPLIFQNKVALWTNLAELTADRFGYIAAPSLDSCLGTFFKSSSGLDTRRIDFDAHSYLQEMDSVLEYFRADGVSTLSTHPINPIRVKALQFFSESEMYRQIAAGQEPQPDESLDKQIGELIQALIDNSSSPLDEHRRYFISSGGLIMAGADRDLADEELERIASILAGRTNFPLEFLRHVLNTDKVNEIFVQSARNILAINPSERHAMFGYLIDVGLADRLIQEREVELLFRIGEQVFGFSRKEIAQVIAEAVQRGFIPRIRSRSAAPAED